MVFLAYIFIYSDSVNEKMVSLEAQSSKEEKAVAKERAKIPGQAQTCQSLTTFQSCRLLLTNMGFLTHKNSKKFLLLESGPRLLRALKGKNRNSHPTN